MAKKTTHKSVSLSKSHYAALQAFAHGRGLSSSGVVEYAVQAILDGKIEPPVVTQRNHLGQVLPLPPTPAKPAALTVDEIARRRADAALRAGAPKPIARPADREQRCTVCGEPGHNRLRCPGAPRVAAAAPRIGLCANCTNVREVRRADWDGKLMDICTVCETEAPRERDHLFGGSARSGVGEGNRRAKSAGTGSGR